MTPTDIIFKRIFDVFFSFFGLLFTGGLILLLALLIFLEMRDFPFFTQTRFGQFGKPFIIFKLKTMRTAKFESEIDKDRITILGKWLRKFKFDELPQFWNVLKGDMSMVGPRPDFLSLLDELKEEDKIILSIKPGITGPASIKFMNEEQLLACQPNPEEYNRTVIWPEKVEINKKYILEYSFLKDIKYILKTIF